MLRRVRDSVWGQLTSPRRGAFPATSECHLWPVRITTAAHRTDLLDHGELNRAGEFVVRGAKDTFVTSRAAQRVILSHYLDCQPWDVTIARDCLHCGADHGRPYVGGVGMDFNVSHSADWLLIAVLANGRVGVDLESRGGDRSL